MSLKLSRKKYNRHLVEYVSENMDWTPTKKYTYKMCEFIVVKNILIDHTNESILSYVDMLVNGFKLFDRYSINFEKRDIMQYKTEDEFLSVIEHYITNFTPVKVRNMFKVEGKLNPGRNMGNFNGYNIVKIDDFKDSSSYSGFCSWCVTKDSHTFKIYTTDEKQFYFALKTNYQKIKKTTGDNPPYDEYGLSMLAIRVCKNGDFDLTTRWNHEHGNDIRFTNNYGELESLFDYKDIHKIIKPKSDVIYVDIMNKIGKITNLRLICKIPHQYIFDKTYNPSNGYGIVTFSNKENFVCIDTNQIISDVWFDSVFDFKLLNGMLFSIVCYNLKYNVLNTKGKLVSEIWYDNVVISNNFFVVQVNRKYNTMNINGEILNDRWFDSCRVGSRFNSITFGKNFEYLDEYGLIMKRK